MLGKVILLTALVLPPFLTAVTSPVNAGSFQISEIISSSEKRVIKNAVEISCVDINRKPGFLTLRNYEARNVNTKELTTGTDFWCRSKKPKETIDWKTLTEKQKEYSHPSN